MITMFSCRATLTGSLMMGVGQQYIRSKIKTEESPSLIYKRATIITGIPTYLIW
jgi:hypothetical protein